MTASRMVRVVSSATPAQVAGRGQPGGARQHRGGQRDGDQRVRQDPDRVRVGVRRQPAALAADGGAAVASLVTTISASWVTSTKPSVHLASRKVVTQPGVPEVEARPEVVAGRPAGTGSGPPPGRRCRAWSRGRAAASWPGGEGGAGVGAAEDDQEQQQHADRDHVVGDRRPHHRAEPVPGVQHLAGQHDARRRRTPAACSSRPA